MDKEDAIIRLLTEIRDDQREEIAWRKDNHREEVAWRQKVMEESMRLQRVGVRRQLLGLAIGGLMILVGFGVLAWAWTLSH